MSMLLRREWSWIFTIVYGALYTMSQLDLSEANHEYSTANILPTVVSAKDSKLSFQMVKYDPSPHAHRMKGSIKC